MKKRTALLPVVFLSFVFSTPTLGVGPGKKVEYEGGGAGKVFFSGDAHRKFKCSECHPPVFKMKKGASVMTMKDMYEGKSCGVCHNGSAAFATKEAESCARCHKRQLSSLK